MIVKKDRNGGHSRENPLKESPQLALLQCGLCSGIGFGFVWFALVTSKKK